ncbi:MAG: hypothetical protein DWH78_11990 [Planctomycetota bacterium]|jgi:hypothetical protein|nr:MAG: hypothetical protein DWH78_11990 [Planctomycetota bacterium]
MLAVDSLLGYLVRLWKDEPAVGLDPQTRLELYQPSHKFHHGDHRGHRGHREGIAETSRGKEMQTAGLNKLFGWLFHFEPLISDEQVSRGMLGDLVNRVFDGSAEAVMLSLLDVSELDEDALKRLRKAFNQKLKEKSHE